MNYQQYLHALKRNEEDATRPARVAAWVAAGKAADAEESRLIGYRKQLPLFPELRRFK